MSTTVGFKSNVGDVNGELSAQQLGEDVVEMGKRNLERFSCQPIISSVWGVKLNEKGCIASSDAP